MVQKAISIPEPTNNVDSLWSTVKSLKEAVEMIQGVRGDREYALLDDVLSENNNLQVQIDGIDITGGSGATELNELSDVNTSTPTNRHALMADGVDFESRLLVEADVSDLGNYLADAPSDGITYGRLDGSWADVGATGGASVVAQYRFDTSTAEADPGNGDFRMNNATPASVTEIFVSSTTDNGNDFDNMLGFLSSGDQIYIQQDNDAARFILLDVTANVDNTGWYSIAGTIGASGTLFGSNAKCHMLLLFGGTGGGGGGLSASADEVITGDWEFQTNVSGNEALTIYNPDATSALKWGFGGGEPGINDDDLLLSSDVSAFGANIEVAYRRGAAVAYTNGAAVGNNAKFASLTSAALAYYMPYDDTGQHGGEIFFRGESPGPDNSRFHFASYTYGDSGLQLDTVLELWTDQDYNIHADFAGNVNAIGDVNATNFNGVPLTTGGAATNYLDETGAYSVPPGGGGDMLLGTEQNITASKNYNTNVQARFGTGNLSRIFLGGSNDFIIRMNAGIDFQVEGGSSGTELMIRGVPDLGVSLYWNGLLKFSTITDGISVTGDVGAATFNDVALTDGGAATNYLDETGAYSVPVGGTEINDLTVAVTWANIPDANVPESAVTQHEDAIDHDQLTNGGGNSHFDWTADLGINNLHANNSANDVLALTSGEVAQLANIGGALISAGEWSSVAVLVGTNTGDQTSIVGITGTMAQFDTAVTDGNIAYAGGAYHDGFSDHVANEHLDWTASVGTIHTDNYIENATHTGQVTGSGALILNSNATAITAQPASGTLIGADTILVNDGGVLSEATMDQVATFTGGGGGATIRHIQVSGVSAQALSTVLTMDLVTINVTTGTGDFTLSADVVTIVNAATYEIHAQCSSVDIDTSGGARTAVLIDVEINSGAVAGGKTRFYHRETEENTGNVTFLYVASASDTVRVRLTRLGQNTNIETIPTECKLIIRQIS